MALSKEQMKQLAFDISSAMDALDRGMTPDQLRDLAFLAGANESRYLATIDAAVGFHSLQPEGQGRSSSERSAVHSSDGTASRARAMATESREIAHLWIGSKVEMDYVQRGVFQELRSSKSIYATANGSRFKVSRALLKAVAEDAIEQRTVKRSREERGLACSYGTMSKNLLRELGMDRDTRIEAISTFKAERAAHNDSAVRALFARLSIPGQA